MPGSEQSLQTGVRIEASKRGMRLWRNNSGAVHSADGRFIRFGLGNESKAVNSSLKSHDLIGITPYLIKPEDVGKVVGIFTSVEVKKPGWRYTGTPREVAQKAWGDLVQSLGGIAKFVCRMEDL